MIILSTHTTFHLQSTFWEFPICTLVKHELYICCSINNNHMTQVKTLSCCDWGNNKFTWFEKDSQPLFSFAFCESKESSCPSYSLDCGSFFIAFWWKTNGSPSSHPPPESECSPIHNSYLLWLISSFLNSSLKFLLLP